MEDEKELEHEYGSSGGYVILANEEFNSRIPTGGICNAHKRIPSYSLIFNNAWGSQSARKFKKCFVWTRYTGKNSGGSLPYLQDHTTRHYHDQEGHHHNQHSSGRSRHTQTHKPPHQAFCCTNM
jgi:hypothetical protein